MPRTWPHLPPSHCSTPPLLLLPLLLSCLLVCPAETWRVSAASPQSLATATVVATTRVSPLTATFLKSSTSHNAASTTTKTTTVTTNITTTTATTMSSPNSDTATTNTTQGALTDFTITTTSKSSPQTTARAATTVTMSSMSSQGPCLPTSNIQNSLLSGADEAKGPHQKVVTNTHQNVTVVRKGHTQKIPVVTRMPLTVSDFFLEANDDSGFLLFDNNTLGEELDVEVWSSSDAALVVVKAIVMCTIIIVSVLGNVLVIVSVALHRRLHTTANYLLVSLATADMLVALFAMTFNASVELSGGRWMFGRIMCDLWNSFDVYFSTVSILHLCCISVDRYYAIVRPLEYPLTITRRILTIMLAHCWLAPTLISFLPILLGWYTTSEHLKNRDSQPYVCAFVVNAVFALVSSAVSFWVPCTVMVVMYYRIFQEARKQEQALLNRACSANAASYSASIRLNAAAPQQQHQHQQQDPAAAAMARQQLMVALQSTPFTPGPRHQEFLMKTFSDTSSLASVATTSSGLPSVVPSGSNSSRSSSGAGLTAGNGAGTSAMTKPGTTNGNSGGTGWRHFRHGSTASWHGASRHGSHMPCNRRLHSTPLVSTKTGGGPIQVGRREHKAARTLGLIMGAFVLCWLPFFTWYVSINVCGPSCRCPHAVVTALFWIGYFNSTLNPFIYAYFRTDFREAFHRTLKRMRCCRPRQPAGVFV